MRRTLAITLVPCLIVACAPPHRFIVMTEGDAASARLTLRGETDLMAQFGTTFNGERNIGDASGQIVVTYADGHKVRCRIGYITNGEAEPHVYSVRKNRCWEFGQPQT